MRTLGQAIEQAWGLADQIEAEESMASIARADIAAREGEGLEPHWQDVAAAENHERAAAWYRELRARRIAMGRPPDDEVNAVADLACPACGGMDGDCGCAAAQAEIEIWDAPGPPTVREKVDEAIRRVMSREHDGSTGREFLEAATEALGGGLELRGDMGFCLGCGSRDCCCPAVTVAGPLLRCGAFRLRDCGGVSACGAPCEPANEAFPF